MWLLNPYRFGRLWTPADITTALWLDATDSSTITLTSGAISQWSDKSGNARNATQSTPAARPTYDSTGLNSKGIVTFDGTGDFMLVPDFYVSDWCIVTIARHASSTTDGTFIAKWGSADREVIFRISSSNKLLLAKSSDGSAANSQVFTTTANAGTSFGVFGAYKNGTAARLSINGSAETFTFTNGAVHNGPLAVGVGAPPNVLQELLNGSIQQLVIVPGAQTVDTFQRLEGWAAWSSGLAANLSIDHPFKNAAPTI